MAPIHEAAENDKDAEIRAELAKGVAVDTRGFGNETAAMRAARLGSRKAMEALLFAGASLELKDDAGWTVERTAEINAEVLKDGDWQGVLDVIAAHKAKLKEAKEAGCSTVAECVQLPSWPPSRARSASRSLPRLRVPAPARRSCR